MHKGKHIPKGASGMRLGALGREGGAHSTSGAPLHAPLPTQTPKRETRNVPLHAAPGPVGPRNALWRPRLRFEALCAWVSPVMSPVSRLVQRVADYFHDACWKPSEHRRLRCMSTDTRRV